MLHGDSSKVNVLKQKPEGQSSKSQDQSVGLRLYV